MPRHCSVRPSRPGRPSLHRKDSHAEHDAGPSRSSSAASTLTPIPITSRRSISAGRCWRPRAFRTTTPGYGQALDWLTGFGEIDASRSNQPARMPRRWSGTCASTRRGRGGQPAPRPHPPAERQERSRSTPRWPHGFSWPARRRRRPSKPDGIIESIRMLRVARNSAVKSRTAATVQIRDLIITAPQPLRDQLADRKTLRGKVDDLRPIQTVGGDLSRSAQAAKFALRSLAQRIEALDREIAVSTDSSSTSSMPPRRAPQPARNLHRSRRTATRHRRPEHRPAHQRGSFAALCGASPIPASSGKTTRHRLNPGGDRQANRALHLIAVCRLATATAPAPTPSAAPPKARPSARSCAASSATSPARSTTPSGPTSPTSSRRKPAASTTTIICGSPGFGITRKRT